MTEVESKDARLSEVITSPTIQCAACGRVAHVTEAMIATIIRRFGGEVFDLSRWEPWRVRRAERKRGARSA